METKEDRSKMAAMIRAVCRKQEETFCSLVKATQLSLLLKNMTWRKTELMKTNDSPGSSELLTTDDLESSINDLDPSVLDSLMKEGTQIVHWVSVFGTPPMMDELLSLFNDFTDSRTQNSSLRPLLYAAEANNTVMIQCLLRNECDRNAFMTYPESESEEVSEPLLVRLVRRGIVCPTVFQTLLQEGGIQLNLPDSQGRTALWTAVEKGKLSYVRSLVLARADPNFSQSEPVLIEPVIFGAMSAAHEWPEQTARVQIVGALLTAGADPNIPHQSRPAPLYSAVMTNNPLLVEMLLKFGADPDAKSGQTGAPIIYAACRNSTRIVEMLMEAKADVNAADGLGYTALHRAAGFNFKETALAILRDQKCDVELKTERHQESVLNHAASSNNPDIVQILVQHGCDLNTTDALGNTPLHYLAITGCVEGVRLLLDSGCDPDIKNAAGATPLWHAVQQEHLSVSRVLLQHDVDLSVTSKGVLRGQGSRKFMIFNVYHRPQSLLWVAVERANSDLIELLISAGVDLHAERWILTDFSSTGNTDAHTKSYLTELVTSPPSLFHMCKSLLLKLGGRNLNRLSDLMKLPKPVQRFLTTL